VFERGFAPLSFFFPLSSGEGTEGVRIKQLAVSISKVSKLERESVKR
jgi:hypothetical protein